MGEDRLTTAEDMDGALARLSGAARPWARLPAGDCVELLDSVIQGLGRVAERWVEACCRVKGIAPDAPAAGEEWIGLGISFRQARMLRRSLEHIARGELPPLPGSVSRQPDGHTAVQVMPRACCDRIVFDRIGASVVMEPGREPDDVTAGQACAYTEPADHGSVAALLGAGNQACLITGDVLHKLFVERRAVAFKPNPVLSSLGPLLEEAFADLVRRDVLAVVYGGADEGRRLVQHQSVDEVHMTGGRATYNAILYGDPDPAEDAARVLPKRMTAELGNVSPVIVVPGRWADDDLRRQAEYLAATLTHNAGYNCLTTHLLVLHAGWDQRRAFLDALRQVLSQVPARKAWYPGARKQWQQALEAHPEAEQFGDPDRGALPWTLVAGVQPRDDEPLVVQEHFCPVLAEVPLRAPSPALFLRQAVRFVNDTTWGDLTATVLIDEASAKEPELAAALEYAVSSLRYGTVCVNAWGATAYATGVTPWGAWAGHEREGQSGCGFVNNSLMLEGVRKTVVRAPFLRRLKPIESMRNGARLGRRLARFQQKPGPLRLAGLSWSALVDS
jgi:aldehyde dehydrogenase (NAD(P)+)